jgi:hypothetical protein|nr:MAG TPA: FOSW, CJUN PROTEIN, COILED COIL DOMAIN [Caudoviricetes sp.]
MTTPATRHPWLWNTKDIRDSLNSYREGKGYGGAASGDPEAMADDIEDLLDHANECRARITELKDTISTLREENYHLNSTIKMLEEK